MQELPSAHLNWALVQFNTENEGEKCIALTPRQREHTVRKSGAIHLPQPASSDPSAQSLSPSQTYSGLMHRWSGHRNCVGWQVPEASSDRQKQSQVYFLLRDLPQFHVFRLLQINRHIKASAVREPKMRIWN